MLSAQGAQHGIFIEKESFPNSPGANCHNMSFIGMCSHEGYGFQAAYSGIGYINQSLSLE